MIEKNWFIRDERKVGVRFSTTLFVITGHLSPICGRIRGSLFRVQLVDATMQRPVVVHEFARTRDINGPRSLGIPGEPREPLIIGDTDSCKFDVLARILNDLSNNSTILPHLLARRTEINECDFSFFLSFFQKFIIVKRYLLLWARFRL